MDREGEVLRHDPIHVDDLHARPFQRAHKLLQLPVPVQVPAVQQPPRPRKDRRDRVRRRLAALLILAVVPRDGPMRRFALDGAAVWRYELRCHHPERPEALREDVGLHVSVVILRCPDKATGRFDHLCYHVVDKAVLVIDTRVLE